MRFSTERKNMMPEDLYVRLHSSIFIADNGNVYPRAGWQDYIVGTGNCQYLVLLSDTKLAKDGLEDFVGSDFAGDAA